MSIITDHLKIIGLRSQNKKDFFWIFMCKWNPWNYMHLLKKDKLSILQYFVSNIFYLQSKSTNKTMIETNFA